MANPDCVEQANCDGTPMTEGDYTYCTKHFLSESAYLQIRALEAKIAELKRAHECQVRHRLSLWASDRVPPFKLIDQDNCRFCSIMRGEG